ncbi:MAG: PfkB family carbohydrate kinase [Bacillota bacterium]|nr:PfkB family carbohydrate kinase [Bacillota bacterium]
MIAIIGGIQTVVKVKMATPERDIEKQRKQDEDALLAAGIDITKLGQGEDDSDSGMMEESPEDARFREYYERKLREQSSDNYWDQVGLGGKDFGGYSPISAGNDAEIKVSLAGCSYNVAKYIGKKVKEEGLSEEKPVFISVLGNDALGLAALGELQSCGVDISGIKTVNKSSSVSVEICNVIGDLEFARDDMSIMDELTPDVIDEMSSLLHKADAIFIDGSVPVETMNHISTNYGDEKKIFFDPASIQGGYAFAESELKATCVMPGRMESEAMSGMSVLGMDQLMSAGECFEERGVDKTIITLKGGGLYYKDGPKAGIVKPPQNLGQVDTRGAGDVVSAEIALGLVAGETLEDAAKAAIEKTAEFLKDRA